MPRKDPRIDAYIAKSADFAKPILTHIRKVVHAACPDVQETIKWGMPFFDYHGTLCLMSAFKAHAAFGFWKNALVIPANKRVAGDTAMGAFGRLTKLSDLPSDKIISSYIKKAMKVNEAGVKAPRTVARAARPELKAPPYFMAAVRKNKKALVHWESFPPGHRREYIEWVTGAKTEPTRDRRLATTVAQVAEGKAQNWKYERSKK